MTPAANLNKGLAKDLTTDQRIIAATANHHHRVVTAEEMMVTTEATAGGIVNLLTAESAESISRQHLQPRASTHVSCL